MVCAVTWCCCLTTPESQYCAVHGARGKDFRLAELAPGQSRHDEVAPNCVACGGEGTCDTCHGDGTHRCHASGCYDEHECGACDGTGDCDECQGSGKASATVRLSEQEKRERRRRQKRGQLPEPSFEERYIAFAFDRGWVPHVLIDYPWTNEEVH